MASSKSNKGRNGGGAKIHHQAPVVASGNTSASGLLDAVAKQKTETLSGYIRQIVEALTKEGKPPPRSGSDRRGSETSSGGFVLHLDVAP